jgi:APA family basic amino acid/polyamine antiporter
LGGGHLAAAAPAATRCAGIPATLPGSAAGFSAAILAALYAYNGWTSVTCIAGEVLRPATTLPRALIGGVGLVLILYVLANAAFIHVLGPAFIASLSPSGSIGVAAAEALFGPSWAVFSAGVLFFSATATMHIVIFTASRVTYALACDGVLFAPLAKVSANGVPMRAVIATSLVSLPLVLIAGFDALSDYLIFVGWMFFVATVVGLFVLRRREPHAIRPYQVFGYPLVPAAFVLVALWVLVQTLVTSPGRSSIGIAIVASSVPVYLLRRSSGREPAK